jgi:hypothetical protein
MSAARSFARDVTPLSGHHLSRLNAFLGPSHSDEAGAQTSRDLLAFSAQTDEPEGYQRRLPWAYHVAANSRNPNSFNLDRMRVAARFKSACGSARCHDPALRW